MKKVILSVLILVIIGAAYGFYLYNKKTPSLEGTKPFMSLTANELYQSFSLDETEAIKKYQNKVLQVSGEILSISQSDSISNIILNAEDALFGGINCSFNSLKIISQKGDEIQVKGRCHGFLNSVILNNCLIVK